MSSAYLALKYPFYGENLIGLSTILSNDELTVTVTPLKNNEHNVTAFELLSICAVIKDKELHQIFEIGTYDGRTTRAMAFNINNEGMIYTLNLSPGTVTVKLDTGFTDVQLGDKVFSGERFLHTKEKDKIEQLWGDSASFDFTPYHQSMDLVFIDGAHSCEYVANDTNAAFKLVKLSGGFIIWHDAHLYGVVKFLKTWMAKSNIPVYFIKDTSLAIAQIKNGLAVKKNFAQERLIN